MPFLNLKNCITGCLLITPGHLLAGSLTLTSNLSYPVDDKWPAYTYTSQDTVRSLNEVASELFTAGSDSLVLSEAPPIYRFTYLATAGQIAARIQWANSVYFGHELIHFQNAHRFGLTDHYFVDQDSGEKISNHEAYWRIFKNLQVGGPATSSPGRAERDHGAWLEDGIETSLAGLNAQMRYSEKWIVDAETQKTKTAFDSLDFIMNRMYTSSYALGDYIRHTENGWTDGDVYKFAAHINSDDEPANVSRTIGLISMAANFFSPAFLGAATNLTEYVKSGKTELSMPWIETRYGDVTWDIPQYLNKEAYTLSPTLYWKDDEFAARYFNARSLLASTSYEGAVLGVTDPEISIATHINWDHSYTNVSVSFGTSGTFSELEIGHDVAPNLSLFVAASISEGSTLSARRNLPYGKNLVWAGARLTF